MQKLTRLLFLSLLFFSLTSLVHASGAMDQLKSLAGEWDGKTSEGKPVHISYKLVSGGSTVMETLQSEHDVDMITMYHPDGNSIMMTHYCMAQNQPRMKAAALENANRLDFQFLDATNLSSPNAGHMHELVLTFQDHDHITQQWTWKEGGKTKVDTFTLIRKS